jgi:predicted transposase/invertase (TIGR01784 family)
VNRNYKSSVFASYFSDEDRLIEAYNAIEGKQYPKDTEVKINTLTDVLFMEQINDVSFLLAGKLIVLIEHQSYPNKNLPVRMLLYISRVYEKILDNKNVYRDSLIKIPKPDFIVLYNGDDGESKDNKDKKDNEHSDKYEMKLSDAFEEVDIPDMLELTVCVYNISQGRNQKILQKSKALRDYAAFIGRIKENRAKGHPLAEAIKEAVRYCIEKDIMKEYLESNASEVENMLFTEFNIDDAKKIWREEALEEGIKKGIEKGIEKNREETAKAALAKGFSVSDVVEITGLDEARVRKLKSGLVM